MAYKFEVIGEEEFIAAMERMASSVKPALKEQLQEAAENTRNLMRGNAPKRTGQFAGSIHYEIDELEATVSPNDREYNGRPVTASVEYGRPAGSTMPPYTELAGRLGVSIAEGFLIARAIARKGIKENPFIRRTRDFINPILQSHGMQAMVEVARRFK